MLTHYGQSASQHAHSLKPMEDDDQTIHERGVLLLKTYEIRHLIRDNFRGEFYPSGLFFHVFLPKKIHHFAFFEVLFRPILIG